MISMMERIKRIFYLRIINLENPVNQVNQGSDNKGNQVNQVNQGSDNKNNQSQ